MHFLCPLKKSLNCLFGFLQIFCSPCFSAVNLSIPHCKNKMDDDLFSILRYNVLVHDDIAHKLHVSPPEPLTARPGAVPVA